MVIANKINEILNKYGLSVSEKVVSDIKNKKVTPRGSVNSSGKLAASIRFEVDSGRMVIYALDYIYFLEYGRKNGKMPPKKAIEDWVKDKGIKYDITLESLVYLIQSKIAKEGTDIYKQGGSDLVTSIISISLIESIKKDLIILSKEIIIADVRSAFKL